jgi:hypothetical protein
MAYFDLQLANNLYMYRLAETSGPVCYLEVFYFSAIQLNYSAPAPPPGTIETGEIYPWTHPCPRTPLPNGNCTFAFTKEGDIQLWNSAAGRSALLWRSNTTALGATTLAVQDYDILNDTFIGNLVLYNSSGNIVWAYGDDSDYGCDPGWSASSATKQASVTSLMSLALISLGAAVVSLSWDSETVRSGWNHLLVVGFVVCCLLLPSTSESKPIQAGFSTYVQYSNFSVTTPGLFEVMTTVAESLANRTALVLHGSVIGKLKQCF